MRTYVDVNLNWYELILVGTYIENANFGDMDYATSDPAEITLTLKYDYAILQF